MITSPISRPITSRIASAIAGARVAAGRWYLHWGGVNQYAQHSTWNMSGFGDRIEFSFVADDPGVGSHQYLFHDAAGTHFMRVSSTSASLYFRYLAADGVTAQNIIGPTIVAGVQYTGYIEYGAGGVSLTVNGTEHSLATVPLMPQAVDYIAATQLPHGYFPGTIHYLRYVNATALQGVNAVMGNGVDLYGEIPEITLTGDFEIEFWWKRHDASSAATKIIGMLDNSNNAQVGNIGNDILILRINGSNAQCPGTPLDVIADYQDVKVRFTRTGALAEFFLDDVSQGTAACSTDSMTIEALGKGGAATQQLGNGAIMWAPKITDKSGAEDVVYEYDLSGDDGSDIPITIDGVASTAGEWQNYDSGVDQLALPVLSRNYKMNDGPDALFLEDSKHPLGPELMPDGVNSVFGNQDGNISSVVDAGRLAITGVGGSTYVYHVMSTVPGKTYQLTCSAEAAPELNSTGVFVGARDGAAGGITTLLQTAITEPAIDGPFLFTAIGTVTSIRLGMNKVDNPATAYFNSISVKCIETGAVLYNVDPEDWDRSKS